MLRECLDGVECHEGVECTRTLCSHLGFSIDSVVKMRPRDSCRLMSFDELFSYAVHISVAVPLALRRIVECCKFFCKRSQTYIAL